MSYKVRVVVPIVYMAHESSHMSICVRVDMVANTDRPLSSL